MPVSREDADRVHAMLTSRAVKGRPDYRTAIRIGLGAGPAPDPPEVATTYRTLSTTRADGSPLDAIGDEWLAAVDEHGRVDSGKKAGEAAADLSRMDKEPRWAAGAGLTHTPDQAPDIFIVLAIGHTPHEAAKRAWMAAQMQNVVKGPVVLKVGPVHAIDAKLLRENFEQHLRNAREEQNPTYETRDGSGARPRRRSYRRRATRPRLGRLPRRPRAERRRVLIADDRQRRSAAALGSRKNAGAVLARRNALTTTEAVAPTPGVLGIEFCDA